MRLTGKRAFITAAGQGIGKGLAGAVAGVQLGIGDLAIQAAQATFITEELAQTLQRRARRGHIAFVQCLIELGQQLRFALGPESHQLGGGAIDQP